MLLGGKGGCQQCSCVPCDACTRTCTEPHTGDAFETVYYLYALGEQAGNPSDGYLTATGSIDASDPYDGMDGSTPYYQEVSGSYSLNNTQTRVPCVYRVSFWRSNFPLGPTSVPPPSSTLSKSQITVTCTYGAVRFGEDIIRATESKTYAVDFPVRSGTGDQSENDPHSLAGTYGVSAECDVATFTITARIEWTANKRQHVLYGKVRECYEEGTPCSNVCSGAAPPSLLYLTISNVTTSSGSFDKSLIEGTYVLDRVPNFCANYLLSVPATCTFGLAANSTMSVNWIYAAPGTVGSAWFIAQSTCGLFSFNNYSLSLEQPCGSGVIASGSSSWTWITAAYSGVSDASGSLDWKVEA